MAPEDMAAINARLAAPPVIDVAVSRRMGLFVVSRLAHRHGVKLRLEEAHGGGTTAHVIFPPDLLITPVEGQHALGGVDSRPELTSGVPNTYADAEAAFASTTAPAEPNDPWQTQEGGTVPGDLGGLPRRQPTGSAPEEHPPSGQDLWGNSTDSGSVWDTNTTRGAGTTGAASNGGGRPVVDPYDASEDDEPQRPQPESGGRSFFDPSPRSEGDSFGGSGSVGRSSDTGSFSRPSDTGAFRRPTGDTGEFRRPTTDTGAFRHTANDSHDVFGGTGASSGGGAHTGNGAGQPLGGRDTGAHERPGTREREDSTESFPAVSSSDWNGGSQQSPPSQDGGNWRSGGIDSREGYGSTAYLSRRYGGAQGPNSTVVPPTPSGEESDSLPIFDAIESNWFKRRSGGPTVDTTETGPIQQVPAAQEQRAPAAADQASRPARTDQGSRSDQEWTSAADRGWKAARTAAEPLAGGLTTSGLPKRVPKANLVPGTAPKPENFKQMPARSADRVRNRFSGFQKGVREGRDRLGEGSTEG
jgi:hypothetical protein